VNEASTSKSPFFWIKTIIITDNLSSHSSLETRTWLEEHPRIHHLFIPKGACWLNLQEGWWRLFRRDAASWTEFCQPR
jgi:transposase